jgi:RNA polymerase sigma factor (TIGR02999 family)
MFDTSGSSDPASAIYAELREMAHCRLSGNSLRAVSSTTSLVHDAILKLKNMDELRNCKDVRRMRCMMAYAMRSILIDRARRRIVEWKFLSQYLVQSDLVEADQIDSEEKFLSLDKLLSQLAETNPNSAMVIHLRFFLQLSFLEIAQQMEVSERTALRYWSFGRSWLRNGLVKVLET